MLSYTETLPEFFVFLKPQESVSGESEFHCKRKDIQRLHSAFLQRYEAKTGTYSLLIFFQLVVQKSGKLDCHRLLAYIVSCSWCRNVFCLFCFPYKLFRSSNKLQMKSRTPTKIKPRCFKAAWRGRHAGKTDSTSAPAKRSQGELLAFSLTASTPPPVSESTC